jgi:hypothetical protein
MPLIGKYCKPCQLSRLRQFPGWSERRENARTIRKEIDGETVESTRELTDALYVYVHYDFTVTDGIFIDENIIFSDVTPEWISFCRSLLGQQSHDEEARTADEIITLTH